MGKRVDVDAGLIARLRFLGLLFGEFGFLSELRLVTGTALELLEVRAEVGPCLLGECRGFQDRPEPPRRAQGDGWRGGQVALHQRASDAVVAPHEAG